MRTKIWRQGSAVEITDLVRPPVVQEDNTIAFPAVLRGSFCPMLSGSGLFLGTIITNSVSLLLCSAIDRGVLPESIDGLSILSVSV